MASRAEQKTRLREEREARATEEALRDRRSRRLRKLLIALGAAAAVVVVAIIVSTSGGGDDNGGAQTGPADGAAEVQTLFNGVEQEGLTMGKPDAPVTLIEFADLQCPYCRDAALASLPTIVNDYVKSGQVRVEFRNFAILGADSEKAARAVAGAAKQNRAWPFIDLWYRNQGQEHSGYVTDDFIRRIASGVQGLDADAVVAAANSDDSSTIDAAKRDAAQYQVESTPTFLLGKTGQAPQKLAIDPSDPAQFKQAIDAALGGQ